ncbi:sulfatase-like hydrolase/transferase [Paenibacillus ginsengarvi]|uniref:DUF4976 domain-containing protein n=1 Tax=Paenibacillus ginsengarvi TaxID=400777 RepID=A0A3B0CHF5_9BACL|nr:sulfatase-like hydrolase/transferase [Paenibacillus ginsengarvi]RKN84540.1 DUF4976 domain-containing protein [Paenibacillus ginsengarvi]
MTKNANGVKPNIVFILSDDQGAWALGCAGNKEVLTPNLDALANRGMRFDHFFCASPVCSPARASILTGRIPSQHGVHDWIRSGNVNKEPLPEDIRHRGVFADENISIDYLKGLPSYTELLANHGYVCALSGKWHLGNSTTPQKGFSHWYSIARGGCSYMEPDVVEEGEVKIENRYITDLITENAIRFLDEFENGEQPFYLSVHYTAPHSPWESSEHPETYLSMYNDCPFESVPELPYHPNQNNTAPRGTGERRKELLRGYYASITAMDTGIGQIMAKLDRMGIRDNTLIIFMSDNGMNMGHHGIWGKGNGTLPLNMFDTSVKVPAIFSHPGCIPEGQTNEELVSQYDVFPTLLEYVGISNPYESSLPGRSFLPLLQGQEQTCRNNVVIFDEYGPVRMIRSKDWKYIHRYPYGPHELYDLKNDPEETKNRIDDPANKDILASLRIQLGDWFRHYVIPDKNGALEPVTGFGQLTSVGPGQPVGGSFKELTKEAY